MNRRVTLKHWISLAALLVTAIALVAGGAAAQAAPRRALTVADLMRMRYISDPQRSPDGAWVAYSVSRIDSVKDRSDSDLWMTSWDGATSVRLTYSDESENTPRWSPDGKQLVFLSSRYGAKGAQLWVMQRAGGEAEKLTDLRGGVSSIVWSPDGGHLALVVNDPDPDTSATPKPKPVVVDRYAFKKDGQGYLEKRHAHVWVFDVTTRKAEQVTTGDVDDASPAWSPDGTRIAFVSAREKDADRFENTDVYVVAAKAGATPVRLTTFAGADAGPLSWSPDGAFIAYSQAQEPKYSGYAGGFGTLALVPAAGGSAKRLTEKLDRMVSAARWSRGAPTIVGIVSDDLHEYLMRVHVDGSGWERIGSTVPTITSFSEGADGGIAVVGNSPTQPGELFAIDANGTRQLTHLNAWIDEIALSTATEVKSTSDDGAEVHGILRRPAGAAPGVRLPMIVRPHGGPAGQDGFNFDFEKELLAAQGWSVLAPNYRGSNGRGMAYTVAIAGDWCNKEVRDIRGMMDHLITDGLADETRLGVGGWSYGGILTDCLIAADPRFKAATSGAGVSNVFGMYGHDQYIVQYDLELGQPWKNVDKWMKVSTAFFHADRIRTPTLFLGGSADWNVPVLGGEQLYQALKSIGIPTELIVYPGEPHGIRRPSFQRDRLERYLAWYRRYLAPPVP